MADASLYHRTIVEAARAAENYPRLADPDGTATVDNPLCGDRVTIDVKVDAEVVTKVGQRVRGCLLCEAAGTLIARHAPGRTRSELRGLRSGVAAMLAAASESEARAAAEALGEPWHELETFLPVRPYKSRHECVLLAFEALGKAVG